MAKPKRKPAKAGGVDADGCGLRPRKAEMTPDEELPVASGGVRLLSRAVARAVRGAEADDTDGCGAGAEPDDVFTADEDLPVAAGGVR
jgi:hypothetical protein